MNWETCNSKPWDGEDLLDFTTVADLQQWLQSDPI
jgi:hypothetical protein